MTVPSRTTYDERPLNEVERSFERLCAEGRIVVEAATADVRARARRPLLAAFPLAPPARAREGGR